MSSTSKWEQHLERVRDGKEMLRRQGGKRAVISERERDQRLKCKHLRTAEEKKNKERSTEELDH
jgi:hypothetical protein